jgi:pyruvate dehydrogenase complex dehydrogenase (E1) component
MNSKYYREQFGDWLGGGAVGYKGKIYHWSARSDYYGWEIEQLNEKDWAEGLSEKEFKKIINLIKKCLDKHYSTYTF